MKCPSCGTWYPNQKLFCLSCGELLSEGDGQVRICKYLLLEKIGQGGVGVVYRARHITDQHEVAIKLLNQKSFGDIQTMQRFRREMRMHKKLEHPNITEFIDICEEGEAVALVMEYLSGCNLKEYINHRGALPLGEIIHVSKAVLPALGAAHEQDVIHRDLKPSNIFVTNEGDIKLMDFGLAKPTLSNEDITDSGMTVGTYLYMAPEQILGNQTGVYTDLYAFGIILYRMCTAVLPFMASGGGEFEIMEKQVRHLPQNPKELNKNIPDSLAQLIMDLLAKAPSNRPKSCAEVLSRIELLGESIVPRISEDSLSQVRIGAFSDLNSGIMATPTTSESNDDDSERSTTHTIAFNTLLSAFAIESPESPETLPFDMRRPPSLTKETLKHLKLSISNIPPLPEIWHQVQVIFENPESSPAELAKVIEQDAVLTAYILKTCNSAAYLPSGSKAATDVAIALTRIGMGGAETLILSAVAPDFSVSGKSSLAVRRIWFHGQAIALISSILSDFSQVVGSHSASMFGLLHDIGKLVILHTEPDEKLAVLKQCIEDGQDTLSAELEVLGYSHIDAGMMLALHWKLPRKLHRFIYYHHFPCWQQPESWPPDMQAPIMLVHLSHLTLSSLLKEEKSPIKLGAALNHVHESVWQDNFRTHVKGSESILYKPLHIPMTDAALYSQLRVQLERLKLAFSDLYPA